MAAELEQEMINAIVQNGPMGVDQFMSLALGHPQYGYYTTRDPFGTAGDFITAPEISQMFGEMIGLALAQAWMDQGCPNPFALVELGPGRGTLMADIVRATRGVAGFHAAAQITLVEFSDKLRDVQSETLKGTSVQWVRRVEDLPALPLIFVANEFFDAMPVCQYQRGAQGWHERQVGLVQGALSFGYDPNAIVVQPLSHRIEDTKEGDIVEDMPDARTAIAHIGTLLQTHGGAGLVIDYGDWRSLGDTLQAVKGHASVDPLTHIGAADLTAHVDFEALALASGCTYSRLTKQGVFLERLGITARAQTLVQNAQSDAVESIVTAHRRLTHPQEMGQLFKVLGFCAKGGTLPPGLET
jgi:SAM-dependent MidA family methyltransferase